MSGIELFVPGAGGGVLGDEVREKARHAGGVLQEHQVRDPWQRDDAGLRCHRSQRRNGVGGEWGELVTAPTLHEKQWLGDPARVVRGEPPARYGLDLARKRPGLRDRDLKAVRTQRS